MDRDDELPSARVVREAGSPVLPPRVPMGEQLRRTFAPVASHGRAALENVIGLWPLTVITLVAAALIWSAGT